MKRVLGGALIAYSLVIAVAHVWARQDVAHRDCPPGDAVALVDAKAHVLCLCRNGRVESSFRVALGRGGIDKRHEGDGRTPTGRYALGAPRASSRYLVFVPVAFPTAAEAQAGHSGSDIGIHAPHLGFVWLRHATLWVDWTRGCIAVGSWGDIEQVAAWVSRHPVAEIVIE